MSGKGGHNKISYIMNTLNHKIHVIEATLPSVLKKQIWRGKILNLDPYSKRDKNLLAAECFHNRAQLQDFHR